MICFKCNKKLNKRDYQFGLHSQCFEEWFDVEPNTEFLHLQRLNSDSFTAAGSNNPIEAWNSSFFQGKFRKYSAKLGKHDYILKVQQEEAPELPDVEYVSNQIARTLGISVPDFYLIELYGQRTFVSKNFISSKKQATSLQHLYHFLSSEKDYACENIIKVIHQQTNRSTDVYAFIRICLFDALIGNHDRHGRNLGFIVTPRDKLLAPSYDNVSVLGLEYGDWLKASFNPCGKITTKISIEPSAKDYAVEFIRLGYRENVSEFVSKINIPLIKRHIMESTCSTLMKKALLRLIKSRIKEYQNAL